MSAAAVMAGEVDLRSVSRYQDYDATDVRGFHARPLESMYSGNTVALMDVNGNGRRDFIYSRSEYICARSFRNGTDVTYYQINIPPKYMPKNVQHAGAALLAISDVNGDGKDDLVAWGNTPDRSQWFFWIIDPVAGEITARFFLNGGQDIRADGRWDGNYYVAGTADVIVDEKSITALIIGCTVGYDKYGRGMMAVDPRNGTILWRYITGPNPFHFNTRIADLEGDGQDEIIFIGRSPDNLGGELVNGISDDETRLFVLDTQGNLRWTRFLGEAFGNGELDLGDMTGDGQLEIVTSTRSTPEVWGELAVWDAKGQNLARLNDSVQFNNVRLVTRATNDIPNILVMINQAQLLEYELKDRTFVLLHRVLLPSLAHINLVVDLLPSEGTEIVVSCSDGSTFVLNNQLKPVATATRSQKTWHSGVVAWHPTPSTTLLVSTSGFTQSLMLTKAPFAWHRLTPYAVTSGLLALIVTVWLLMRRPRQIEPQLLRETRLNLLDNLELSNHGAIAPLKCVRRLVWHLRALQTDLGDSNKVEIRMREAWTECNESAVPHLRGILDRAQVAGLAPQNIDIVAAALVQMEKQLEAMGQENFKSARQPDVAESIEIAERQGDAALIRLRAEVATYFRADVAEVMARVHVARKLDLEQAAVKFQMGRAAQAAGGGATPEEHPPASAIGLCDPRELEFVLDNLVGNAIRAMKNTPQRQLYATWTTADGMILIDITDTGRGLAHENWERALNTRYSTKPAGGDGLPNSRRYLRKYGGNLSIVRSAPDKGSTFRVTIPEN